jgi:hypothetical protein
LAAVAAKPAKGDSFTQLRLRLQQSRAALQAMAAVPVQDPKAAMSASKETSDLSGSNNDDLSGTAEQDGRGKQQPGAAEITIPTSAWLKTPHLQQYLRHTGASRSPNATLGTAIASAAPRRLGVTSGGQSIALNKLKAGLRVGTIMEAHKLRTASTAAAAAAAGPMATPAATGARFMPLPATPEASVAGSNPAAAGDAGTQSSSSSIWQQANLSGYGLTPSPLAGYSSRRMLQDSMHRSSLERHLSVQPSGITTPMHLLHGRCLTLGRTPATAGVSTVGREKQHVATASTAASADPLSHMVVLATEVAEPSQGLFPMSPLVGPAGNVPQAAIAGVIPHTTTSLQLHSQHKVNGVTGNFWQRRTAPSASRMKHLYRQQLWNNLHDIGGRGAQQLVDTNSAVDQCASGPSRGGTHTAAHAHDSPILLPQQPQHSPAALLAAAAATASDTAAALAAASGRTTSGGGRGLSRRAASPTVQLRSLRLQQANSSGSASTAGHHGAADTWLATASRHRLLQGAARRDR